MIQKQKSLFVLVGKQFDEALVVSLSSPLWDAGWLIKLIGRTTGPVRGKRGFEMLPGISLEQALRLTWTATVILIPCTLEHIHFLKDDPRYVTLLQRISQPDTLFIVSDVAVVEEVQHLFSLPATAVVAIEGDLTEAVAQLTTRLEENALKYLTF